VALVTRDGEIIGFSWRALRDSNPCYRRERADTAPIVIHRRHTDIGSSMIPRQKRILRLYGWLNIAICASFGPILVIVDYFAARITGRGYVGSIAETVGVGLAFGGMLLALHSIPGFVVLAFCYVYWRLADYRDRDVWLLTFIFAAVEAPNIFIMAYWIGQTVTREAIGKGEALTVTWLIPIKLMPITVPVGFFLGLVAFQIFRSAKAA
jgi:hypothetical protein